MFKHCVARLLALSFFFYSVHAAAIPENPFLTPEHPTPEDTIVINAYTGPCDVLESGLLPTEVTRDGEDIAVLITGGHFTNPEYCLFTPGIWPVPIGNFPAGSYVVTINWRYSILGEWEQATLGVLPLTIANAPSGAAVSLPTVSGFGMAVLALVLAAVAAMSFAGAARLRAARRRNGKRRITRRLAFSFFLYSVHAAAIPENPFLTPEHPTSEDTIVINAYTGPCDVLESGLLPTEVTRDGEDIAVLITGGHFTNPEYCLFTPGIWPVPIGNFPAGSYVVTINWRYSILGEWEQATLGVLPLTIANAPAGAAVSLPTVNGLGMAVLAIVLAAAAGMSFAGGARLRAARRRNGKRRITRLLAFSLFLYSVHAAAIPENPFLTPEHPTPEDTIVINAYTGPCDIMDSGLLPTEITRDGAEITVLITGEYYTTPELCFFTPGIGMVQIGSFPAGSYTVIVNWQYHTLNGLEQLTIAVIPLTIASGPVGTAVSLPTVNDFGMAVLAIVLVAFAAMSLAGAARLRATRHRNGG